MVMTLNVRVVGRQDGEKCCLERGVYRECLGLCRNRNTNGTNLRSDFENYCEKYLPDIRNCTPESTTIRPKGKLYSELLIIIR